MKCPFCGHEEDKVVDSRNAQEGRAVRRRRECLACSKRYTTYEYVEKVTLTVVKNDGRREDFDRQKLFKGITLACNKRPISEEKINSVVAEIEEELQNNSRGEVTSQKIGELVMDRLKKLDEVAYVRFASVYRKFKDKSEFLEELRGLLD
ncbi:MAG: transcriptional regulator NrdR [candidate division Zixibacteria bacterium RBG_16_48_11]|nr:MAG: transcriptional regulator NrdR [candidate division Zixibacteria bacterium RBG_16_48_11]